LKNAYTVSAPSWPAITRLTERSARRFAAGGGLDRFASRRCGIARDGEDYEQRRDETGHDRVLAAIIGGRRITRVVVHRFATT
jgi:hypothetical protein